MMLGKPNVETAITTKILLGNFAAQLSGVAFLGSVGGGIGMFVGEVVAGLTNPNRGRRDQLLENHREFLAQQLSDDQLGALFIQAVSGSEE